MAASLDTTLKRFESPDDVREFEKGRLEWNTSAPITTRSSLGAARTSELAAMLLWSRINKARRG